jgi:hypothetical protein
LIILSLRWSRRRRTRRRSCRCLSR